MKIIRNGQEIKLTKEELHKAYIEQQHILDMSYIKLNIENYLDEDEYEKLRDNQEFIEDAAYELRENLDRWGMEFDYAIKDAIETTSIRYDYWKQEEKE